jgi:hypothetical protein
MLKKTRITLDIGVENFSFRRQAYQIVMWIVGGYKCFAVRNFKD